MQVSRAAACAVESAGVVPTASMRGNATRPLHSFRTESSLETDRVESMLAVRARRTGSTSVTALTGSEP